MKESRIKELVEEYFPVFDFHVAQRTVRGLRGHLRGFIRTVAAEAREGGIEEMRDALLEEWEDNEIRCGIIILHAERLREKGK